MVLRRIPIYFLSTIFHDLRPKLASVKDLLTFEKLATWRRMNGFDRVADGEDNWFHGPRSLPPTREEYAADLWSDL